MKGPMCAICGHEHWNRQPHVFDGLTTKPSPLTTKSEPLTTKPMPDHETPMAKKVPGRPRKYDNPKEKYAVYNAKRRGRA